MTDTVFERMGRPMRVILLSTLFMLIAITKGSGGSDPIPTMWPERFHAVLYMNLTSSGRLLMTDLWYDWPKGRNLNLMQQQLDDLLHDVEWNNGTSFYYTLGPTGSCRIRRFPVGIPRPDWLVGSTYLGQGYTDGFLCNVWEKLDFVWYYEDVETKKPVRWDFFDGISTHVMTFEVGAELEDSQWQAPSYCFNGSNKEGSDGENIESSRGLDVNGVLDFNLRKLI